MGRFSNNSEHDPRREVPDDSGELERTVRSDPLVGARLGEYVIRERIGEGGMGIVYRGEQPLIGKQVAVKVLRPEVGARSHHVERLLAEARAVNAIRHRGIIDIFSFGQTEDGRQYFVMEYLEGNALDVHLGEHGLLPLPEVLRISDELLDALGAAHEAGVIHRDLKPNNIFMVRQPGGGTYVKVLDFGLAKQTSNNHVGNRPQTQQGVVLGTPQYMAPEQACAQPVSPKTDLYAFGVILFELLTGQLPFSAGSSMEFLVHHVSKPPPSPLELRPELPPALAALVLKLLAKAPEERPAMAKVRAELQRLARTLSSEATVVRPSRGMKTPPPAQRRPRPPQNVPTEDDAEKTVRRENPLPEPRRSRSTRMIAVGGGVLLAAGVGLLLLARPGPQPVATPPIEARAPVEPPPAAPSAEPRATPSPPPPAETVALAPESAPVAPAPVEPAASPPPETTPPVETRPSRDTAQTGGSPRGRTERNPLLTRIERLEKRLRTVKLPVDDREQALNFLDKARDMARDAETPAARKQVSNNLDIWERRYLGS